MPEEEKKQEEKKLTAKEVVDAEIAAMAEEVDASGVIVDGKVKVDTSMPASFMLETQAELMVEHLIAFHKWMAKAQAARAQGENQLAESSWREVAFNRLVVAMIQNKYPDAKKLADTIMETSVEETTRRRSALLGKNVRK